MPFEDIPSRLEDILDAIKDIEDFVSGKSFDDYRRDTMLRLAIEPCVEIISEASRHVPSDMKAKDPEVPWQNVTDIGNVLRHAYRSIDPHIIGRPQRAAVEQMLRQIEPEEDCTTAIALVARVTGLARVELWSGHEKKRR